MTTAAWPQFKRFKTRKSLQDRAKEIFKDAPDLQAKWVAAVEYLRNHSKKGWVGDERIPPVKSIKKGELIRLPQDRG